MSQVKFIFKVLANSTETLGIAVLKSRGFFPHAYWYWIGIGALIGFMLLFNICFTLALTYLNRGYHNPCFNLIYTYISRRSICVNVVHMIAAFGKVQAIKTEESQRTEHSDTTQTEIGDNIIHYVCLSHVML